MISRNGAASAGRLDRLARLAQTAWCVTCLVIVALLVGVRWLRYAEPTLGPGVDRLLREAMVFESQSFLWTWAYTRAQASTLLVVIAVLVVGLHRRLPGRLVHAVDGAWRLRPIVAALFCAGLVAFHYLLDLNPTVARVCMESLLLLAVTSHPRIATRLPVVLRVGLWVVAIGYWIFRAFDPADRIAIATWVAFLLLTDRLLGGRMTGRGLTLLRLGAVVPANLLPAVLPLLLPLHGGTHLGDGLAYSFCASPDGKRIYAAVPVCDSIWQDYDHCRDGAIVEYDATTLARTGSHRFFSPGYFGRFEMLLCLDDQVLVTLHGTVRDGREVGESVLAFTTSASSTFDPAYADGTGATIAYDAVHDALFYSGEFNDRVVRYTRATGRTKETSGTELRHDWVQPVSLRPMSGSQSLDTRSIHPGRNRIYVTQWMQGRYVHAVDLTTMKVVARYDVGGGGALGLAVDAERDRLLVSSLWGLDVFDLATDRLIARKRLGLANRPAIVDGPRNRLYVTSTVEGKIRVLDRDTFRVLAEIPVGIGNRFSELSRDGMRLFGSSVAAHYWWDADALVAASSR